MSRRKHHRIALKYLPPQLITEPVSQRARAKSQYVERITFILLITILLVISLFSLPEPTGRATVATTVNITQSINVTCSIPLQTGLNIISLNCISNSHDRNQVLANTDTSIIAAIYEYRNKQTDQWRVYNPNLPSYVVQDLSSFSRLKGYLVYIEQNSTVIDYSGTLASQSYIPIFSDNNLVGYPSVIEDTLPKALTTINDTYSRVRTYNGTAWIEYNVTNGSAGGLTNLTPTEGYWITSTTIDTWILNYNNS